MISIIICSRTNDICPELKENIASTIGDVPYEIIAMDNSANKLSIFEAYREGTRKARFKFLLFMHDDILYVSRNWGNDIVDGFKNPQIGMLGIVGGCYASKYSLTWWTSSFNKGHIYDGTSQGESGYGKLVAWNCKTTGNDVVAIDGVWMCIRKELFDNGDIFWDAETYRGFHFYDFDISMQVKKSQHDIVILKNLSINHFSTARFGKTFYVNAIKFHKKWDDFLPIKAKGFSLPVNYKEGYLLLFKNTIISKLQSMIKMHNNIR